MRPCSKGLFERGDRIRLLLQLEAAPEAASHDLRKSDTVAVCLGRQSVIQFAVDVKLRPMHDVYYTSPRWSRHRRV